MVISTRQTNNKVFNGFLVDMTKIDSEDHMVILAEDRALPLSNIEKEYIDSLYHHNIKMTNMLSNVSKMYGKKITKKIQSELHDMVEASNRLANITPDVIGRGYVFSKKVNKG